MKIFISVTLFFLLSACSSQDNQRREGSREFSFTDISGTYVLKREVKTVKKKLVTRSQVISSAGGSRKVLEKTIAVSQLGSLKRNPTMRPYASEFTVWLEGKKYQSRLQLVPEKKSMQVTLDSPEKKWQGVNLVPFPQGRHFCFFSQVPDCLYFNQLLQKARQKKKKRFSLFVVWDNYPYLQDQLVGVGKNLFSPATLKYDGEINGRIRYILEIEGQIVLYHFSKNYTFEKLAWISQGITLVPPGEEESGIENQ